MKIEPLNELRGMLDDAEWNFGQKLAFDAGEAKRLLDRAEREVSARFMELPLDADGVPVRPGDKMTAHHGGEVTVAYVNGVDFAAERDGRLLARFQPQFHRHARKPTVEEVLREFADSIEASDANYIPAYAERIREAVRDE